MNEHCFIFHEHYFELLGLLSDSGQVEVLKTVGQYLKDENFDDGKLFEDDYDKAEKLSVFLAIKNQIKVDSWIKQEIDKNERRETQWKEGRSGITG